MRPIRLLFNAWADAANVNAQNLNAREIACRLDPERFAVSFFSRGEPDPKLAGLQNVRLLRVPSRLGAPIMVRHMLGPYDAMFYLRMSRADTIFRYLRRRLGGSKVLIAPVESQMDVLDSGLFAPQVCRFWDEVAELADVVVANSPYVAETYRDRYGGAPQVIVNGIDAGTFRRLAAEHRRPGGRVRVVFAGSLQERKHPELVLDAARRFPAAEFVLIGDGPLRPRLERSVAEWELANVELLRARSYHDYARLLVTADVFLFPSRIEGLPRVTLEAAAAGIPVVVFDDYRAASVVHGTSGFRVATEEEMMASVGQLIGDPELRRRMGAAAAEHARGFDWGVVIEQWERLFEASVRECRGGGSARLGRPR